MSNRESIYIPLRIVPFRALWVAGFFTNLGGLMFGVAGAWLMTSLTTSPALVALVQTAFALPAFLVSLPSGVLADVFGKRVVLFYSALWSGLVCLLLALFTALDMVVPWLLLFFVALVGVGQSAKIPAWQSIVPDIVPRDQVPAAISLNSINFNLTRTVGPALGGLLVSLMGSALVFLLTGLSNLAILVAVRFLKHPPPATRPTARGLVRELWQGMRRILGNDRIRGGLIRMVAFVASGIVFWAFMPLLAREEFGLTSTGFGLLLTVFGVGSIIGSLVVTKLRRTFSVDGNLAACTCLLGIAIGTLALSHDLYFTVPAVALAGFSWVVCMINFNVTIQLLAPSGLRARVMALYFLLLHGSWALSSALLGWLASLIGIRPVLGLSAGLLFLTLFLSSRIRLDAPASPAKKKV